MALRTSTPIPMSSRFRHYEEGRTGRVVRSYEPTMRFARPSGYVSVSSIAPSANVMGEGCIMHREGCIMHQVGCHDLQPDPNPLARLP